MLLKTKRTNLVLRLDLLLILLFLFIPMNVYLNTMFRGFVSTWIIFSVWMVLICLKPKTFNIFLVRLLQRRHLLAVLIAFLLIVIYNYLFRYSSGRAFQYVATFFNFVLLIIIDTYYSVLPKQNRMSILYCLIVCLGVQAAISIPYLLQADGYVVRLFSSGQLDDGQALEAIKNGVGNNGLYSSIGAMSILGLSIVSEFKGVYSKILIVSIVCIIISVLISTLFASIVLLAIGFFILFLRFYHRLFTKKILFSIILAVISGVFFYQSFVSKTRLLDPIEKRFSSFIEEQQDVTGRTDLAQVSLNTFKDNPFWGVGVPELRSYSIIGEHMPWVDYLAHFGVFGVFPFVLFLGILVGSVYKYYHVVDRYYFYRSACLIGVIVFFLSNFISPMVTVPSMYMPLILFFASDSLKDIGNNTP